MVSVIVSFITQRDTEFEKRINEEDRASLATIIVYGLHFSFFAFRPKYTRFIFNHSNEDCGSIGHLFPWVARMVISSADLRFKLNPLRIGVEKIMNYEL